MKAYPVISEGGKAVLDDVNAGLAQGGKAHDYVRAQISKLFVEGSNRKGYVVPVKAGPIVKPDPAGGTGKVQIEPFHCYRSAAGATSNAGKEDASGGTETQENVLEGFYPGGLFTVPTPLPSAGNHNWYLIYATWSESDQSPQTRPVQATDGSVSAATVNTRHGPNVTINVVQGTAAPQATDPFPAGNFPVLPAPDAWMANVPLCYVHVFDDGTPGTVTYNVDRLANDPRFTRAHPGAGLAMYASAKISNFSDAGPTVVRGRDIKSLVTAVASASGGWPVSPTGKRPARVVDPIQGWHKIKIDVGPWKSGTFSSSWLVVTPPLATPDPTDLVFDNIPLDFRDREFRGELWMPVGTSQKWAHDGSASLSTGWPTGTYSGSAVPFEKRSIGNSIRDNSIFNVESSTTGWRPVCMFRDVSGASANNDVALVVSATTGALHLAVREATADLIANRPATIFLEFTDRLFPFGYAAGA